MVRFETRAFYSELQRQLNRDAGVATMEVVAGGEDALQVTCDDRPTGLSFGPYGVSPLSGLHFVSEDDTATS
jgi:hypothetical protein